MYLHDLKPCMVNVLINMVSRGESLAMFQADCNLKDAPILQIQGLTDTRAGGVRGRGLHGRGEWW